MLACMLKHHMCDSHANTARTLPDQPFFEELQFGRVQQRRIRLARIDERLQQLQIRRTQFRSHYLQT